MAPTQDGWAPKCCEDIPALAAAAWRQEVETVTSAIYYDVLYYLYPNDENGHWAGAESVTDEAAYVIFHQGVAKVSVISSQGVAVGIGIFHEAVGAMENVIVHREVVWENVIDVFL